MTAVEEERQLPEHTGSNSGSGSPLPVLAGHQGTLPSMRCEETSESRSSSRSTAHEALTDDAQRYVEQCKVANIRPNRRLLSMFQQSVSSLVSLQLGDTYLGDLGVTILGKVLSTFISLRALGLASNGIANDGTKALCGSLDNKTPPLPPPLSILDLSGNPDITRVGGQLLLNTVGRHSTLCVVLLEDTRVTDYFSTRIQRHCDAHMAKAEEPQSVRSLLTESLNTRRWSGACRGYPASGSSKAEGAPATHRDPTPTLAPTPTLDGGRPSSVSFVGGSSSAVMENSDTTGSPNRHGGNAGTSGSSGATSPMGRSSRGPGGIPRGPSRVDSSRPGSVVGTDRSPSSLRHSNDPVLSPSPYPSSVVSALSVYGGVDAYDEAFEPDYTEVDDMKLPAYDTVSALEEMANLERPEAPSLREYETLLSSTPNFEAVSRRGSSGQFSIHNMPFRSRTVYGFRTPTPFGFYANPDEECPDSLVEAVFAMVGAYEPKDIVLPTKLLWPGKLSYAPAVHAPDPFLYPSPPSQLTTLTSKSIGEGAPSSSASASATSTAALPPLNLNSGNPTGSRSMFLNFIESARGTGSATTTPRTPVNTPPAEPLPVPAVASSEPATTNNSEETHSSSAVVPTASEEHSITEDSEEHSVPGEEETELAVGVGEEDEEEVADADERPLLSDGGDSTSLLEVATLLPYRRVNEAVLTAHLRTERKCALEREKECLNEDGLLEESSPGTASSQAAGNQQGRRGNSRKKGLPSPNGNGSSTRALVDLLNDPFWSPTQPLETGHLSNYLSSEKLNVNAVSATRAPISTGRREYLQQCSIRSSVRENITAGALNPAGTVLAVASYDMTCKLWSIPEGQKLRSLEGHTEYISDVTWIKGGDQLVTCAYDFTAKIWEAGTGMCLHTLRGHNSEILACVCSTEGKLCATGAVDETAILWDVETGASLFTLEGGHTEEIVCLALDPTFSLLASGGMDGIVVLWDTAVGRLVRKLEAHRAEVCALSFNCHGNQLLSASSDDTAILWDTRGGERGGHRVLRGHSGGCNDCKFSADGWYCATASEDATARVWDVISGGCLTMMVGHKGGVCNVAFDKSGKEVITSSLDSTVRVWDAQSGACLQILRGHRGMVMVQYCPQTEQLMTMAKDNCCKAWKLEPPHDTLLHQTALALCQHPTLIDEAIDQDVFPSSLLHLLRRIQRKIVRATVAQATTGATDGDDKEDTAGATRETGAPSPDFWGSQTLPQAISPLLLSFPNLDDDDTNEAVETVHPDQE